MTVSAKPPRTDEGHDILDQAAVSVPCAVCGGRYEVTLRHILLAQQMMHDGCPVHDERECAPLVYAPLATRSAIGALQRAWTALAAEAGRSGWELTLAPYLIDRSDA